MLKAETKTKLKALGFDVDKLVAAAAHAEEQDFEVPAINNLSDADLAERDKNTIAAAKGEIFKTGKDAGIEIANKAIVKKYGLTDIDTKDPDKVIAALDAKVATGDAGLKQQVDLLQKDKQTLEAAIEAEKANVKSIQFDTKLLTSLPANRAKTLTDSEYLTIIKSNLQFEEVEGQRVVKRDGVILRDSKTQAPIPESEAIKTIFTERKWIDAGKGGGRGGDDTPGGGGAGMKKFSQFSEQYLKDNPASNLLSPEFQTAVAAAAKDTTDFDWDN